MKILYKDKVLEVTLKKGYMELFWHLPETATELEFVKAFCEFYKILKKSEIKNVLQKGDIFAEKFAKPILFEIQNLVSEISEYGFRMASVMGNFDDLDTINLIVENPLPTTYEKKFKTDNEAIKWLMNIEI